MGSRVRWIACSAALLCSSVRAQSEPGLRFDPCVHALPQRWSNVELDAMPSAAPRDGWMFAATLDPPFGSAPGYDSIQVEVLDADAAVVAGQIALQSFSPRPRFAWRPVQPLAPLAQLVVKVTLENRVPAGCAPRPNVERSFALQTRAELSPALPEPPLRAIGYGEAWSKSEIACCEPLDKSACADPAACAKCWSWRREPTIVSAWDAPLTSEEPLEYGLFYGKLEELDPNQLVGFGFGAGLPTLPFRPLSEPRVMFPEGTREVCLTAGLRNFRTGQRSLRVRCAPVQPDASGLAGIALVGNVQRDPPTEPDLSIGSAACASGPAELQRADVQVAARHHAQRATCLPACDALLPLSLPVPWSAGAPARVPAIPQRVADMTHELDQGCRAVDVAADGSNRSLSDALLWLSPLLWLRARRLRARPSR